MNVGKIKMRGRIIFAALFAALLAAGCKKEKDERLKIGIIQIVEHPSLDDAYKGFIDYLKEKGLDESTVLFDYRNAQGEQANCQTIASKLVNDKNDLILAIGTQAAQATANLTKTIPIVISCISDPVSAKLVSSASHPGSNVTGVSDFLDVADQIRLITKLLPDSKTVGLLYSSNEQNSHFQIEKAKEACEKEKLKWVEVSVTQANELQQATLTLCQKADVLYTPTDNMISAGVSVIAGTALENKTPLISGSIGDTLSGGFATSGIDYYELGRKSAEMAYRILKGGEKAESMPIEYMEKTKVVINEKTAKRLGIHLDTAGKESE